MTNTHQSGKKFHYAWIILFAATIILATYMPAVTSLFNKWQIAVTEDLGFSRSAFSLNTTIVQAVGIFIGPIASKFLTERNFKRLWTIFAAIFGLGLIAYAFAQNAWHFYIISFVIGFAFISTTSIPMTMMINNWFVEKRGLATSIAFAGISAGGFIFSPIITYLITNFGWRHAYLVYGIVALVIAFVFGIFIIDQKPEDRGLEAYGYQHKNEINPEDKQKEEADQGNNLDVDLPIGQSWTKAFFILLLLGAVANGLANGGSLQFSPGLTEAQGPVVESITVSAYLLVGVFGKILMGWINDKFGFKVTLFTGMGALALSFVSMLLAGSMIGPVGVVVFFGGLGIATGTVLPPIVTSTIYSNKRYGEAYGYVTSSTQIGTAIGPLLVPLIYDTTGSYAGGWWINIIFAVAGAIFWYLAYQFASNKSQG
ncbi:hypothetical protein AWM75_05685 [Aerococcus urinaehominis]|uniref:Uncharacterized protein n=1 Tax=Aerococcus urinaehominis TaxID=128944 RepID=A0A120IAY2_9LACT|nr:MFS transporter [Aerococcus urinaehominis]AMB99518.1 hypothetical protein AWM75_05685 [Aerococcus urinaehominis]SDM25609.1 Predicted arabinose efflux permease, MFS family [Aerococcus urinaehominis]